MEILNMISKHSELMKNWKKPLVHILIIAIVFILTSELLFGLKYGYETGGQGEFKDRLFLEGEIEYNLDNLLIYGDEWVANFYNLSSVYIRFNDSNGDLYEKTHNTSQITFKSVKSGNQKSVFRLTNITKISDFCSATFRESDTTISLDCISDRQITGVMENTTKADDLTFVNIIILIDNNTINASQSEWEKFYMTGTTGNIGFNVSLEGDYLITSSTEYMGDHNNRINLRGQMRANDFSGIISSNGKFYISGNPILYTKNSGFMRLTILQNPEPEQVGLDRQPADWELEFNGENVEVEGFGLPYWSIGLLLSFIPSTIIIFYNLSKKKSKEMEES
jgi:hypothetical protein